VGQVPCHPTDEHDYINTVVAALAVPVRLMVEDFTCPSSSWHDPPRVLLPRGRRQWRRAPWLGRAAPATQVPAPPARVPGASCRFTATQAGRHGRHSPCNIVCCCKGCVYIYIVDMLMLLRSNVQKIFLLCCIIYFRCFIILSVEFVIVWIKMVVQIGCCMKHLHLLRLDFSDFFVYVAKSKSRCCNTVRWEWMSER
jgi:hypothetical protein